jgi:hypothetical protein
VFFLNITLNSCFISHGIKSKRAFKQRIECNYQRRYSIIKTLQNQFDSFIPWGIKQEFRVNSIYFFLFQNEQYK